MKFNEFLGKEDPAGEISQRILDIVFDENNDESIHLNRLSSEAKIVYFSWWCDAEIHNGGFDQFFFNSSGDYTQETMDALNIIGASISLSLFEKAISWFPNSRPDPDREKRWKQMEPFGESVAYEKLLNELDAKFYKYEDNISNLVNEYISKNQNANILA